MEINEDKFWFWKGESYLYVTSRRYHLKRKDMMLLVHQRFELSVKGLHTFKSVAFDHSAGS